MSIQKIRRSVLAAAGVGVIAAAGLMAGRLWAGAFPQGPHRDLASRLAHIFRALDLSIDQTSRIKTVLRAHAEEIKTQLQASADARRGLREAVMAQPFDENAVRAAAQRLGEVQGDGAVLLAKIRVEVDPILTADQKEKIQQFQERMRQRGQAATQAFDNFLKSGS